MVAVFGDVEFARPGVGAQVVQAEVETPVAMDQADAVVAEVGLGEIADLLVAGVQLEAGARGQLVAIVKVVEQAAAGVVLALGLSLIHI